MQAVIKIIYMNYNIYKGLVFVLIANTATASIT